MKENITLLYVDDEPINIKIFQAAFRRKYKIVTAQSGHEGLLVLQTNDTIDVVLTDLRMPGMDGIEFIRKAKEQFSDLSYFVLTAYNETRDISSALDEHLIQKYFRKPFDFGAIHSAIEEAYAKNA